MGGRLGGGLSREDFHEFRVGRIKHERVKVRLRQEIFCPFRTYLKSRFLFNSGQLFHLTQKFRPSSGQILSNSNFFPKKG